MTADEMLAFRRLQRENRAMRQVLESVWLGEVEHLRDLLRRGRDLAKYAVDIPGRELEAEQFLSDVDKELEA